MPIIGSGKNARFSYKIPNRIKALMSDQFLKDFKLELHKIFPISDDATYWSDYSHVATTFGWNQAFNKACEKHGSNGVGLQRYYNKLPWYDSDLFDDEMLLIMVKKRLIKEGHNWEIQ